MLTKIGYAVDFAKILPFFSANVPLHGEKISACG